MLLLAGGGHMHGCWQGACVVAGDASMVAGRGVWLWGMHGKGGHAWQRRGVHVERRGSVCGIRCHTEI